MEERIAYDNAAAPGPEPADAAPALLPTANILVADDDPKTLYALEHILDSASVNIVTARNGEEALKCVLAQDFALILLDVRMPGMDGYETAALIRKREKSRHIPIIFLTAVDKDDVHMFRGYTAGAVDYVFKPVEPLILKSKVNVFVELFRKSEEIRREEQLKRRLEAENFRVRTEKLRAAEDAVRDVAPGLDTSTAAPGAKGREVVLCVEDDAEVRRVTADTLGELGYEVIEAAHGAAALETLEAGRQIDLLFTDVAMPCGMSGRQLARAMRARLPNIRVLYTSGYADRLTDPGDPGEPAGLLKKPYRDYELARAVRQALDAAPMAPESTV